MASHTVSIGANQTRLNVKRLPLNNLRTMNSCARMELLRICAVQLQLPGSKSETQNRQRLPQDPQIPVPSFPRFQIICSSKAIFTSVLKSFGEFSVFLCLSGLLLLPHGSPQGRDDKGVKLQSHLPAQTPELETCRILQDHGKHVFFPLFSNRVFVEFDALLGHMMNINEW